MKPLRINVVSESAFTVQGHGVHTAFTETVNALRHQKGLQVFTNSNQKVDVTHLHTVGLYSLIKLITSKSVVIVSAHVMPDSFVGSIVGAVYWRKYAVKYLRWFYNKADAVLAVSQEVSDELNELNITKPIYVVPNTIDTSVYNKTTVQRTAARKNIGLALDEFVVVGVGQIQPRKRVDSFVDVAKKLPQFKFMWVGGIPFKKAAADYEGMQRLIKNAPSNMMFKGEANHAEMANYYAASNLFFLPSEQETFGIVIVEAAASGLPILLRDLSQYRHTFKDAYIYGNDKNFAEIIERISSNKKLYNELSRKAEGIALMYDSKTSAARLVEIYKEVIATKP